MKLSPRDAGAYFAKPDPGKTGLLIYGDDAMRVALKRQEVIAAIVGPAGEEEMRLTRISASDLRKQGALLLDAVKEVGFFPGPRVAFVEGAGDGLVTPIAAALEDWRPGDAQIVVTAGMLKASSALRKLFERHPTAYAAAIYNDPPSRAEIEADLARAGLTAIDRTGMDALTALSKELDPGDFRQTVEKLALYKLDDSSPLLAQDVEAVAPTSTEADVEVVLHAVAEGNVPELGSLMQRLAAQGAGATTLVIRATFHFRALHLAATDPGGVAAGISRARPPIFGARRDRMQRQAQGWGVQRLEQAIGFIHDADLALRSAGQTAPSMAVVERLFIRLAMLSKR